MTRLITILLALVLSTGSLASQSHKWGTLKPNLFFALKELAPEQTVLGLAWMVKDWRTDALIVRHAYQYGNPSENVRAYYESHDGEGFAREVIIDRDYNAKFTVEWVQQSAESEEDPWDLTWSVRVVIEAIDSDRSIKVVPFLYLSKDASLQGVPFSISLDKSEDDGDELKIHGLKVLQKTLHSEKTYQTFEFAGQREDYNRSALGVFALNIVESKDTEIWQPERVIEQYAPQMLVEKAANEMDPNLIIVRLGHSIEKEDLMQKSKPIGNLEDQASFAVSFKRASHEKRRDAQAVSKLNRDTKADFFSNLEVELKDAQSAFDARFNSVFITEGESLDQDIEYLQFQKEALSNLLGNVGHSYGSVKHLVRGMKKNMVSVDGQPFELVASYPSRSRFARGFLWDEGFHLMIICRWSDSLCIDILSSWLSTLGEKVKGEIMKEQARGPEAQSLIPDEDLSIPAHNLSPPSLFMPLNIMLDRAAESTEIRDLVREVYPLFAEWYAWYEARTLSSSIPCTFSYRNRQGHLNEQSALDDYPRGMNVHDKGEIHLDLQSQMIEFALTMQLIGDVLDEADLSADFGRKAECYATKMHEYLLNEQMGIYADYVSLQVKPVLSQKQDNFGQLAENIEWREDLNCGVQKLNSIGTPAKCNQPYTGDPMWDLSRCCRTNKCQPDPECSCPLCTEFTSIDDDHLNYKHVNQHSVHLGIVNLWPLFYGLVDDEQVLKHLFDLIEDERHLRSPHGIRSLSARDQFYQLDSATYRGNLFVHLHYLLLRGLKTYYGKDSIIMEDKSELAQRASEIYSLAKSNLVETVYSNWRRDHAFWEMYDADSGEGKGTTPFSGWTSLILLIANDLYH